MWRFTMFFSCLIAALAGSPLRQAEAAGDLGLAGRRVVGDVIETVDGGVGDDAGETTLTASGRACAGRKFEYPESMTALAPRTPASRPTETTHARTTRALASARSRPPLRLAAILPILMEAAQIS